MREAVMRIPLPLGKWLILGLEQKICKTILEDLVVRGSKEVLGKAKTKT